MSNDQRATNGGNDLPPTILVIFGITGDLSHRFLLPALIEIAKAEKLPQDFKIIGVSRHAISHADLFRGEEQALAGYGEALQMDLESDQSYQTLKNKIQELGSGFDSKPEVIFYLSVPPAGVLPIVSHLGRAGLNSPNAKLLLEKPFGVDLQSARALIAEVAKYFPEDQCYRIDHFLAKEMAQNIVVFLGGNSLFRSVWSNQFIEKIEIQAAEQIGIQGRANFYESTGALRDIMQSHLLQLAALVLMEPCSSVFGFEQLPQRRLEALKNLQVELAGTVRGQYAGYREEVNNRHSVRETFVALALQSSDPRWSGVPINLATGKNLAQKFTQICIYFKKTNSAEENLLVLRIQPKEGIELNLWVKQPGYERKLQKLPLEFNYDRYFGRLPEAYEQVLVDVMASNHSLFAGGDEVLASWEILQPVLEKWAASSDDLVAYPPGESIHAVLRK